MNEIQKTSIECQKRHTADYEDWRVRIDFTSTEDLTDKQVEEALRKTIKELEGGE